MNGVPSGSMLFRAAISTDVDGLRNWLPSRSGGSCAPGMDGGRWMPWQFLYLSRELHQQRSLRS